MFFLENNVSPTFPDHDSDQWSSQLLRDIPKDAIERPPKGSSGVRLLPLFEHSATEAREWNRPSGDLRSRLLQKTQPLDRKDR